MAVLAIGHSAHNRTSQFVRVSCCSPREDGGASKMWPDTPLGSLLLSFLSFCCNFSWYLLIHKGNLSLGRIVPAMSGLKATMDMLVTGG